MIFKYPRNVVREIVVAAELRRFGKLFNRFTREGKEVVRDIAAKDDYREVLAAYRKRYGLSIARSFLVALLPALVLYCFVPVADAATDKCKKARGDTEISVAQYVQCGDEKSPDQQTLQTPECIADWLDTVMIFGHSMRTRKAEWLSPRKIFSDEIDCIPKSGCWVGELYLQTH